MAIVTKGYAPGMLGPMQFYAQGMLLGQRYTPRACCQHSPGMLEMILRARRTGPEPGLFSAGIWGRAYDCEADARLPFPPDNCPLRRCKCSQREAFSDRRNCKLL
jgi:hypothetical protein